jgi:ABC-type glycerol-3-phosphate transport system permease component
MVKKEKISLFFLSIFTIIYLFPFLVVISIAFKSFPELFIFPPTIIPRKVSLEGFSLLFASIPIFRWLLNSFLVSSMATIFTLFLAIFPAYALSRMKFKGQTLIYRLIISSLMIPLAAYIVPLFLLYKSLGWINSYYGLINPVSESVYAVFFLTQFFKSLPMEIEEAAIIDGCSRLRVLFQIILPNNVPAIISISFLVFFWKWNMFYLPLVIIDDPDLYPVAYGIVAEAGKYIGYYNLLMSGIIVTITPLIIMYFIASKYIIESFMELGVKR